MASWRFRTRPMSRSSRHRAQRKSPSSRFRYAQRLQPPSATRAARLRRQHAALRSRHLWQACAGVPSRLIATLLRHRLSLQVVSRRETGRRSAIAGANRDRCKKMAGNGLRPAAPRRRIVPRSGVGHSADEDRFQPDGGGRLPAGSSRDAVCSGNALLRAGVPVADSEREQIVAGIVQIDSHGESVRVFAQRVALNDLSQR